MLEDWVEFGIHGHVGLVQPRAIFAMAEILARVGPDKDWEVNSSSLEAFK